MQKLKQSVILRSGVSANLALKNWTQVYSEEYELTYVMNCEHRQYINII